MKKFAQSLGKALGKIASFFQKYWRTKSFWFCACTLLVFIAICITNLILSNIEETYYADVQIGETSITLHESEEDAKNNAQKIKSDIEEVNIHVMSQQSVAVYPSEGNVNVSNDGYTMNLDGLSGHQILFTVELGGDGTYSSRFLSDEVKRMFFAVEIEEKPLNLPSQSQQETATNGNTTTNSGNNNEIPIGTVYFGNGENKVTFPIYGSGNEAQSTVQQQKGRFTLPENMLKCTITAIPNNAASHINISVLKLDNEIVEKAGPVLSSENNWTKELDLSKYKGKQVTLCLQYINEGRMLFGYQYVSFFVPE